MRVREVAGNPCADVRARGLLASAPRPRQLRGSANRAIAAVGWFLMGSGRERFDGGKWGVGEKWEFVKRVQMVGWLLRGRVLGGTGRRRRLRYRPGPARSGLEGPWVCGERRAAEAVGPGGRRVGPPWAVRRWVGGGESDAGCVRDRGGGGRDLFAVLGGIGLLGRSGPVSGSYSGESRTHVTWTRF